MIVINNNTRMGRTTTGTQYGGDMVFRLNAGDICEVLWRINGLSGSPSAAALAASWQFSNMIRATLDEDTVSASSPRTWFDVKKSDPRWADYFVDEDGNPTSDWPATLFDLSKSSDVAEMAAGGVFVSRKIKMPAGFLVRAPLAIALTGGTSPSFTFSQAQTQYSKL